MSEFIEIPCATKKDASSPSSHGIRFEFYKTADSEPSYGRLLMQLGKIAQAHLNIKVGDKIYASYSSKNNFRIKIKKCKASEGGCTIASGRECLCTSFFWLKCSVPSSYFALSLQDADYNLAKEAIIIDLMLKKRSDNG